MPYLLTWIDFILVYKCSNCKKNNTQGSDKHGEGMLFK